MYDYAVEKRKALDNWAELLGQIVTGASNVTPLSLRA